MLLPYLSYGYRFVTWQRVDLALNFNELELFVIVDIELRFGRIRYSEDDGSGNFDRISFNVVHFLHIPSVTLQCEWTDTSLVTF